MRKVLLNPHVDDFVAEPLHFRLFGRRALKKYGFIVSETIARSDLVYVLIDYRVSAFIPCSIFKFFPLFVRKVISSAELFFWGKTNKISANLYQLKASEIVSTDVLLAFSYKSARGSAIKNDSLFYRFGAVIFHLSHFFVYTNEKSQFLKSVKNVWLAGDSDISSNPYFLKYFEWYKKPFLVMPFSVSERFSNKGLFRRFRCVATGSFHDLMQELPRDAYNDYMISTGLVTYHPLRAALFHLKEKGTLDRLVKCLIRPYRDYKTEGWLRKTLRHFLISQKKYFSIDIVDLYNQHSFAVVGEEFSGFPALGAFEAMACGAVLIGYTPAYNGHSLVPGTHYLSYDGTVDGLLRTLRAAEGLELGVIAKAGQLFVANHLSSAAAFRKWDQCSRFALENCGSSLSSFSSFSAH